MQTISAIGRYIKENGGVVSAISKVMRLSWMLLRESGVHALIAEIRNTLRVRLAQVAQIRRKKALVELASLKKVTILATPHTMYVAYMLSYSLSAVGFRVAVITSPPSRGYGKEVYIVLCPQMFSRLPQSMISFQMEQSTSPRWFTEQYLRELRDSLAILDYSRTNIGFLERQGIPYRNIFYVPIKPIPNYLEFLAARGLNLGGEHEKTYDVLFYGDVNNERRQMILGELGKRFDIKIVGDVFGRELYGCLLRARVVVNIHYYENALLETTRICECLSLGVPVVSESSVDRAEYPELEPLVRFVRVGDVAGMIQAIEAVLAGGDVASREEPQRDRSEASCGSDTSFYLTRFLLAYGLIDFDTFSRNRSFPPGFTTGKICLSLPETVARRASFLSRELKGFEVFDGLRHAQGWIGCGLSYKYLIKRAKMAGMRQVLICEDDVVLNRESEEALSKVEEYLGSLNGEWDVFVGLIAHVHPDVQISQVVEFGGLTFVHLNKMTSMVLNIYNHTIYDLLVSWNELNEDPRHNTIDRYLESREQLRVITTLPFIAGHSEKDSSTLWGFGNKEYAGLIVRSQELLHEKVGKFLEGQY